MVFQSYALYAHMSVRDNIGFGLKMAGVPKTEIQAKVAEAAEVLGMSDLLNRKPRQLSGGQRQRVAMGRAIVREPTAFLMDEPLSNLDAKLRVEMRGEITSLQRRIGTPTLYVTHDQTEAMTMGDRVAILRDGVLEQLGTPAELYEQPVNMFVASFIGSPAMNLIKGTCEADAGAPFVRFGNSRLSVPDAVAARSAELRDFVGREICVGIRPEDFLAATGPGVDDSIEVHVTRAESLGSELFVYFQTVGTEASPGIVGAELGDQVETPALAREALTARLHRGSQVEPGARARLTVDTSRLYLFDPETGKGAELSALGAEPASRRAAAGRAPGRRPDLLGRLRGTRIGGRPWTRSALGDEIVCLHISDPTFGRIATVRLDHHQAALLANPLDRRLVDAAGGMSTITDG